MVGNCLSCKVDFKYQPSQSNGKYCSNKCQQDHRFLTETKDRVESGKVRQAATLRRYLVFTKGYVCEGCGNGGTYNGKSLTLQVDHIDGNSDNNLPDNIRLLCPNCHSQTETWVGRNKKNTRRNKYLGRYKKKSDA